MPDFRSTVTPNAQESEDSGLSLSYSILGTDAAKRISSGSSSNHDLDQKDIFEDEAKVLRQKAIKNNAPSGGSSSHDFDFRWIVFFSFSLPFFWFNRNHFPGVHSQFTRITSIEQRRKYKTEFDNDYAEYMRLHADTERVSKRFASLEESLRNEENNDQRYKVRAIHCSSMRLC